MVDRCAILGARHRCRTRCSSSLPRLYRLIGTCVLSNLSLRCTRHSRRLLCRRLCGRLFIRLQLCHQLAWSRTSTLKTAGTTDLPRRGLFAGSRHRISRRWLFRNKTCRRRRPPHWRPPAGRRPPYRSPQHSMPKSRNSSSSSQPQLFFKEPQTKDLRRSST